MCNLVGTCGSAKNMVQGIYSIREEPASKPGLHLDVSTFCVHGSPTGRISGIKGAVTCADPYPLSLLPEFETTLERQEGIFEKCLLRFPAIPFIPPEPYDVLRTDYTSYALVQVWYCRHTVLTTANSPLIHSLMKIRPLFQLAFCCE